MPRTPPSFRRPVSRRRKTCSTSGANSAGRRELAKTTGIDDKQLLEWVHDADLMRIPGVGPQYSDLLVAAGVKSPAELANRNSGNLATTFQEVAAAKPGIVRESRPTPTSTGGSRSRNTREGRHELTALEVSPETARRGDAACRFHFGEMSTWLPLVRGDDERRGPTRPPEESTMSRYLLSVHMAAGQVREPMSDEDMQRRFRKDRWSRA